MSRDLACVSAQFGCFINVTILPLRRNTASLESGPRNYKL